MPCGTGAGGGQHYFAALQETYLLFLSRRRPGRPGHRGLHHKKAIDRNLQIRVWQITPHTTAPGTTIYCIFPQKSQPNTVPSSPSGSRR